MFADALSYPVRNGGLAMIVTGLAMIVTGAIFSLVMNLASFAPVLGLAASLFGAGFFCGFYLDIVSSTMVGTDRVPDWPSLSDFSDDIAMPFLRVVGLVLISFGPALAVFYFLEEKQPEFPWALGAALVWGAFYFPMALLGSVACGNLFGALPHIVLPGIFRALPGYLLAVPGLAIAVAAGEAAQEFGGRIPFVGWLVAAAVGVYVLMMQARLIGLIYRDKREELGWE
jgi:hypothetical protein